MFNAFKESKHKLSIVLGIAASACAMRGGILNDQTTVGDNPDWIIASVSLFLVVFLVELLISFRDK